MMQKVLFTASTLSHIRSFHLPYLAELQRQGYTVHVACGGEGELPEADKLILVPFCKRMLSIRNLKATSLLRKQIHKERYDLIITHTSLAAFFTRLAVKGMAKRPKLINMVHGYLFDDGTKWLKRTVLLLAEKLTARQTDLLLTMNTYDDALARRHKLCKAIQKIDGVGVDFTKADGASASDGTSLRHRLGIADDAFVFLYAAEFSARKNQKMLIHAMARLPENVVLILAGAGILKEECVALASSLRLEGRVLFPGYVSPISEWYTMADAAVTASRSEGLPFHVMEAMYAGLPVVASAVKGHTDLIADEKTGLLYPYNDVDRCITQMLRLAKEPSLCKRLGDAAHEDVLPYALDRVMPQVMAAYTALL